MRNQQLLSSFMGKNFEEIPLKLGARHECPPPPVLLNIMLKVLTEAITQGKDVKGMKIKKEVKLSIFVNDMLL